jgi:hypothetical protein
VDGVEAPRVAAVHQVAQQVVTGRAGLAPGTDHDDRRRLQQAGDGAGVGALLPGVLRSRGVGGGLDGELDADDAVLELGRRGPAGVAEDADHPAVVGQRVGEEPGDAPLPGGGRQVLEQERAEPAALVRVVDHERHLRRRRPRHAVVAGHCDEPVAQLGDEGDAVVVVHRREALDLAGREAWSRREEAEVDRPGRQAAVEGDEGIGVGRGDGATWTVPPSVVTTSAAQCGGGSVQAEGGAAPVTASAAARRARAPPACDADHRVPSAPVYRTGAR